MINTAAALRVANIIAAFKWVAVGVTLLVTLVLTVVALFSDDGGAFLVIMILPIGIVYAGISYAILGWFEHTLRLLAGIASSRSQMPTASPYAPPAYQ